MSGQGDAETPSYKIAVGKGAIVLPGLQTVRKLSRKSELAAAFRDMRARWVALGRCFDDGRLALDNNPAERALHRVAIGRKNYLFAGSDAGVRRAAAIYSLIESAKLSGLNPQHYLTDVLARIADYPAGALPKSCHGTGNRSTPTALPPEPARQWRAPMGQSTPPG